MNFSQKIRASRYEVFNALIDPADIAVWKVPDGMKCVIHSFDAREGGRFRVSLTYDGGSESGKSGEHTDTYRGYFAEIVPNTKVVEITEFETEDPKLAGAIDDHDNIKRS